MEEIDLISHRLAFYTSLIFFLVIGLSVARRIAKYRDRKEYLSVALSVPSGFLCSFFLLSSNPLAIAFFEGFGCPYSFVFHWFFIVFAGVIFALLFVMSIVKSKKWGRG